MIFLGEGWLFTCMSIVCLLFLSQAFCFIALEKLTSLRHNALPAGILWSHCSIKLLVIS